MVSFYVLRPSDPAVSLVSTANLAALGGYKDPQEALKRYVRIAPHPYSAVS